MVSEVNTIIGVVVIGRNEGDRLINCLRSLNASKVKPDCIVYVDSGSTDGSITQAERAGALTVDLDLGRPFTAARARNAGVAALESAKPDVSAIQFIDGDCEIKPDWLMAARNFLENTSSAAVVAGRLRERYPERSVYNRLCDAEWNTPIGKIDACGGIMMVRQSALQESGLFNPTLIAGEEPELCVRLRRKGWDIWRVDAEMAVHDAAMTRFGQFWARARRSGFAAGEGAAMYGRDKERHGIAPRRRALLWGLVLPVAIVLAALIVGPWALLGLLVYPAQILRLALRDGGTRAAWERALFLTLGKFAEAQGVLEYHWRQRRGGPARLIEYK